MAIAHPSPPSPGWSNLATCCALLLLVQVIFAGYSILTATALTGAGGPSPLVFAFLRDCTGSLLLLGSAWAVESRAAQPRFWIQRDDQGAVLLCGLLSVYCAQGCSALALANITPLFFGLCQPAMPVATLALSLGLGLEPFAPRSAASWGKLGGIAVTVGGALAMVLLANADAGSDLRRDSKNIGLGCLYTAIQVIGGGAFPVAQKVSCGAWARA